MVKLGSTENAPESQEKSGSLPRASAFDLAVKSLLRQAIKQGFKSRFHAAGHLERALGERVTRSKLDDLVSKTKLERRLPACWIPGLYMVVGQKEQPREILDQMVKRLLPEHLQQALEVGELVIESHGTLARALAELEKVVKPVQGKRQKARAKRGI